MERRTRGRGEKAIKESRGKRRINKQEREGKERKGKERKGREKKGKESMKDEEGIVGK